MSVSRRELGSIRITLLLLLALFKLTDINVPVNRHLAYLSLSKALVPDRISATDRQARLQDFVEHLQLVENREFLLPPIEESSEISMLRAIYIGEYCLLQGDIDAAASWYLQATQSNPFPLWQSSLLPLWQGNLLADGNILITDFSDVKNWIPDVNNDAKDFAFESVDGIALISYQNRLSQRDYLAFSLFPNPFKVPLSYHNVLSVRIKLEPGAYLTLATKVDNLRERHLNYYQGTGDWEILRFPLTGNVLEEIKFSISEAPGKPEVAKVYKVWIDWIKLELVDEKPR